MSIAAPTVIIQAFAVGGDHATIPDAPTIVPNQASYTLGFPPATRMPQTSGGAPPFGVDMNGILYDVSSNIAWLQGGMYYTYNASFVAKNTGYAIGAVLRSNSNPQRYFYNRTANNSNNPDVATGGWTTYAVAPALATDATTMVIASGTVNNLAVPAGVRFIDLNPTTGNTTLTGIIPDVDGTVLTISNVHASNLVTLAALTGSTAGNQFRFPADLTILQNDSISIKYSQTIGKWVRTS